MLSYNYFCRAKFCHAAKAVSQGQKVYGQKYKPVDAFTSQFSHLMSEEQAVYRTACARIVSFVENLFVFAN